MMESFLPHFSLKASQWCEAGIYLLASQAVDKCQSQEGAETALVEIEKFLVTAKEHQLSNPKEFYNQFEMILTTEIKVNPLKLRISKLPIALYMSVYWPIYLSLLKYASFPTLKGHRGEHLGQEVLLR